MSRTNSRDLFLLIKSLNKSEKGYITKMSFQHQEKNTNFLRLFTAIDNQDVYNEAELLKKGKFKQLPRLKIYLYERILSFLDSYYSKKNINISLQKMLSRVYVLFNKGLYDQCIKQLYKAKELALRYEKFTILLEIYDLQRMLLIEKQQIFSVSKVQQEENNTIGQIHNLSFYKDTYEQMSKLYVEIIYTRRKEEDAQLKKIMMHKNFSHESFAKSLQAKIIFYKTICKYYSAIDDRKNYLLNAKMVLELAEKHPHYIAENIFQYVKLLNNFIATASENGLHKEYEAALKKLKQLPNEYSVANVPNMKAIVSLRAAWREFYHYKNSKDFNKALTCVTELEKQLASSSSVLSITHQVMFYYQIAYMYFIHNDLKRAIIWANKIINTSITADKLFFHCFARTLILVCHFELRNFDTLGYLLKSTERFFIKHNKLYSLENILIGFLKNYPADQSKSVHTKQMAELDKIITKNFNPIEFKILEYFDVFMWVKSKVKNQPFLAVMQGK